MSVMNIKHLFLAAATLGVFAACSDYDPGMSNEVINYTDEELAVINEYAANFVERYGDIDPNHTWGFGELGSEDEALSTRTQLNVNRNEWITFDIDQDTHTVTGYNTDVVNGENVPGFPSADGVYYIEEVNTGKGYGSKGCTLEEIYQWLENHDQQEIVPVGDVTDEEILYVSTWFRTHPNIESDPFEATSFFAQTISKDYDRQSYGTMTGEGTSSWAETSHGNYITNLPIKYFLNGQEVQYDYNGNVKDPNATGSPVTYELDWLAVQKAANEEYEHINNFNSSNTPKISETNPTAINTTTWSAEWQGINSTSYRMIEYVYNTGTHDFEVHSSNVDEMDHQWRIKHLTFTGRDGKEYDGWYLAFDIAFTRAEETQQSNPDWNFYLKTRDENGKLVEGIEGTWKKVAYRDYDGYYSNYIVKIIPGDGQVQKNDHQWYRIMCEDLGSTYDFDFNDLVFDIYYSGTSGDYTAHIKLQAAGGTYPIYLGGRSEDYEVHKKMGGQLLGSGLYQPINVGGATGYAEEYTIENLLTTNPDDIEIYVPKTGKSRDKNDFTLPKVGEAGVIAPQKICIPGNTTKWTKENQNIELAYPHFVDWVGKMDGQYKFADWEPVMNGESVIGWNLKPGNVTINGQTVKVTPWNTTDVDVEHKYLYY